MFQRTPLLIDISILSTFLPFIVTTPLLWLSDIRRRFLPLWLFFTLAATMELILLSFSTQGKYNVWLIHFYTPIEFFVLSFVLSQWQENQQVSKFIRMGIPVYLLIYLLLKLTGIESFEADRVNYITRPISLLLIVGFSVYTFHTLFTSKLSSPLKDARFWIVLSLVIYYSGTTIVNAFMYVKSYDILIPLVRSNAILNILHNILFTIGIGVAFAYRSDNPENQLI